MSANAAFAKKLLSAVIPELNSKIKDGSLKCIDELAGSSLAAVMTSVEKRDPEIVKKMQFILPDLK